MSITDYDVLVAGAGPVGLMLATELRLAGARVLVVEQRTEFDTAIKAGAINTASAETFERRGLLPALEAVEGRQPFQGELRRPPFVGHFGGIQVPADPVDEDDPSLRGRGAGGWYLPVPQVEVERILGRHAADLGVEVRRGVDSPPPCRDGRPRACSTPTPASGTRSAPGCSTGRARRWP